MSEVTFTTEQIKEIRRRIAIHRPDNMGGIIGPAVDKNITAILTEFPLPKVTKFRTFYFMGFPYRVNGDYVEVSVSKDHWECSIYGRTVDLFAAELVSERRWGTLAAFAEICRNPTVEVEVDP